MLLCAERALGVVEGLDEHLLLPKLDEANLPRKRKTGHESPSFTHTHNPDNPRAARPPGYGLGLTSGLLLYRVL